MQRILSVAWREFTATVLTKAFLAGVLIVPVIILVSVGAAMKLVNLKPPAVVGEIAVIDQSESGEIGRLLAERITPEAIRSRREAFESEARDAMPSVAVPEVEPQRKDESDSAIEGQTQSPSTDTNAAVQDGLKTALDVVIGEAPALTARILDRDADIKEAKSPILEAKAKTGGRLALIVLDANAGAVEDPGPNSSTAAKAHEFGGYTLYITPDLDVRVQALISSIVRDAIVDVRLKDVGLDAATVRAAMNVASPETVAVTTEGDRSHGAAQQMIVPLAFMMLLWISVFTGGQYLLASTIEEKSNRVMEILLSAVSPVQLMTGKMIGQLAAAALILFIYSGLGSGGLILFGLAYIVSFQKLLWLIVFFFITFFMIASLMAAVGSAVTDIHEAQALMMPIMIVVMTPLLLMMPIIYNPDGVLATALSFLPPVNGFVMVLRLTSSSPPPMWQLALSAVIGVVAVILMIKMAAKIFRVGVLLYGKPPNLRTLVRWVWMA
ncbi:MAG: ABC transporter permease [Phycisphaerales bacterium]|nr:MAG: ABC transporter permease [Phycisphaerales bacterium]